MVSSDWNYYEGRRTFIIRGFQLTEMVDKVQVPVFHRPFHTNTKTLTREGRAREDTYITVSSYEVRSVVLGVLQVKTEREWQKPLLKTHL